MRIQNRDITVRRVLFSKTLSFVYLLIAGFFIYKSYSLFPIWANTYEKNLEVKDDFAKKEADVKLYIEKNENNSTDLGKERYKKEFFNKLDEGEEMIVLFDGEKTEKEEVITEKQRHMFFWEKWYQDFLVWKRNL